MESNSLILKLLNAPENPYALWHNVKDHTLRYKDINGDWKPFNSLTEDLLAYIDKLDLAGIEYCLTYINNLLGNYELLSNKTKVLDNNSTDTQYPTARVVWNTIISKLVGVYKYKRSLSFEDLPLSGLEVGDVYDITNDFVIDDEPYKKGTNVAWNGSKWDPLAFSFDSYTKEESDTKYQTIVNMISVLDDNPDHYPNSPAVVLALEDAGKVKDVLNSDGESLVNSDKIAIIPSVEVKVEDVLDEDGNSLVLNKIATILDYKQGTGINIANKIISLDSHLLVAEINTLYHNTWNDDTRLDIKNYKVNCLLSNYTLNIASSTFDLTPVNPFKTIIKYTRSSTASASVFLHIFHLNSVAGVAKFTVKINTSNYSESHNILASLLTGYFNTSTATWNHDGSFAEITSLGWNLYSYYCSNSTTTNYTSINADLNPFATPSKNPRQYDMDCFLEVPSSFVGDITISFDLWYSVSYAEAAYWPKFTFTDNSSDNTITAYAYTEDTTVTINNGWTKELIDNYFGTKNLANDVVRSDGYRFGKYLVDFVMDIPITTSVGDLLSDLAINDLLLHLLQKTVSSLLDLINSKANDSNVVHLTGDEYIEGNKSFKEAVGLTASGEINSGNGFAVNGATVYNYIQSLLTDITITVE